MAIKSIVETDGSLIYSRQTDAWLQERLEGVMSSISGGSSHPDDMETLKKILSEMKTRGLV